MWGKDTHGTEGQSSRREGGPTGPHHASSLSKAAAGELVLIDRTTAEQVRNRAQGRGDRRFERSSVLGVIVGARRGPLPHDCEVAEDGQLRVTPRPRAPQVP